MENKQKIREIFIEVLELTTVLDQENIFDMGGDSLKIYKISELLKEKYELIVKPIDIMMYPSIDTLAAFLNKEVTEVEDNVVLRSNLRNRRNRRK